METEQNDLRQLIQRHHGELAASWTLVVEKLAKEMRDLERDRTGRSSWTASGTLIRAPLQRTDRLGRARRRRAAGRRAPLGRPAGARARLLPAGIITKSLRGRRQDHDAAAALFRKFEAAAGARVRADRPSARGGGVPSESASSSTKSDDPLGRSRRVVLSKPKDEVTPVEKMPKKKKSPPPQPVEEAKAPSPALQVAPSAPPSASLLGLASPARVPGRRPRRGPRPAPSCRRRPGRSSYDAARRRRRRPSSFHQGGVAATNRAKEALTGSPFPAGAGARAHRRPRQELSLEHSDNSRGLTESDDGGPSEAPTAAGAAPPIARRAFTIPTLGKRCRLHNRQRTRCTLADSPRPLRPSTYHPRDRRAASHAGDCASPSKRVRRGSGAGVLSSRVMGYLEEQPISIFRVLPPGAKFYYDPHVTGPRGRQVRLAFPAGPPPTPATPGARDRARAARSAPSPPRLSLRPRWRSSSVPLYIVAA